MEGEVEGLRVIIRHEPKGENCIRKITVIPVVLLDSFGSASGLQHQHRNRKWKLKIRCCVILQGVLATVVVGVAGVVARTTREVD